MDLILSELQVQAKRKFQDPAYMRLLEGMADHELTFEEWISTGRGMKVSRLVEDYQVQPTFDEDVDEIVRYAGGFCGMYKEKKSEYVYAPNDYFRIMHAHLSVIERAIWENEIL